MLIETFKSQFLFVHCSLLNIKLGAPTNQQVILTKRKTIITGVLKCTATENEKTLLTI